MPGSSSKKSLSAKKDTPESYYSKCLTLDNVVFLAAFLSANVVAIIVRLDLAIMMMVPNIFVLSQMSLFDHKKGCGIALSAIALMAMISIDSFCILVTHCLFYMTILLVSGQIQEEQKNM